MHDIIKSLAWFIGFMITFILFDWFLAGTDITSMIAGGALGLAIYTAVKVHIL